MDLLEVALVKQLLKVLVGSRAHNLHTDDSDYDYRAVFQHPTTSLVGLNPSSKNTHWVEGQPEPEGKTDATAWELGHFLRLATHCNPTILEVFFAPQIESTKVGDDLRNLFPVIWNPDAVVQAFIGYGRNQRTKFLAGEDNPKYAVAYLRVLYQAEILLATKVLPVDMRDTPVYDTLSRWRKGLYTKGEVIDRCLNQEQRIRTAFQTCVQVPDLLIVDQWLLFQRQEYFDG